ncbi:MAG: hypothetical protein HUU55_12800 [Myxococcales bacterium]|nr:hypothetical protein [Myxococcales bacterium]
MGATRCWMMLTAAIAMSLTHLANAQDWVQWRKDARRSANSPLLFDFDQTGVRWQFPTGASATPVIPWDLDGNSDLELLSVEGGRVVARRKTGSLLWDTPPFLARRVVLIDDVDSDGTLDIIIDATNSVLRLNGVTGEVLWQSTTNVPIENIGSVLFADTTGDGVPEVMIADVAGNAGKPYLTGASYIFNMTPSPIPGLPLAKTQEGTRDYESGLGLATGDIDGDQVPEIIAPGKSRLYSYDSVTGLLEATSPDYGDLLGKENLASAKTYIRDVDGNGLDEVFLFLDSVFVGTPSRRVVVFQLTEPDQWTWLYTLVAPDPVSGSHTWPALPIQDLDGDGSHELTTSFFSPQGGWETWIVNAASGELLQKLPNQRLTNIFDPDHTWPKELLVVSSPFQVPGDFETRHIVRYSAATADVTVVFSVENALVLGQAYSSPLDPKPQVVVVSDNNADGFGDTARVYDMTSGLVSLNLNITGALQHTLIATEKGQVHIVLSYATGEVSLVDQQGTVTNDANADRFGDIVYQGFETRRAYSTVVNGTPLVSVAGAGGRIIVVDATTGDPITAPNIILQTRANLPQIPLFLAGKLNTGVLVLRSDTSRRLVFQRLSLDNTITWDTVVGGTGGTLLLARDPLVADINGDMEADVIATVEDKTLNQVYRVVAIDGASGQLLWTSPNIPTPGGNIGWLSYLTEKNTLYLVGNSTLLSIDAATGLISEQTPNPLNHYYGIPSLVDIDGDNSPELALLGTSKGCIVYNNDLTVRWEKTLGNMSHAPAAALYTSALTSIAVAYGSSPRVDWLANDGTPLHTRYFTQGSVYSSSDNLPEESAKSQIREIIAAEQVTPDGKPGFVLATSDGFLHAITSSGTPLWTLAFAAGLGSPAVIDVDFDGTGELAVPAAAGTLALIDRSTLAAPAWVYENDGSTIVENAQDDIDIQSSCTSVSVNWAPVAGAAGYVVRLLSANGTLIKDQMAEGGTANVTFSGLSLVPGQLYRVGVAGYESQNSGKIVSTATLSDGFRPQDGAPPQILSPAVNPPVFFPEGEQPSTTILSATFVDDKALHNATITIGVANQPAQWTRNVSLNGTVADWLETFDGNDDEGLPMETGTYEVRFSVTDTLFTSTSKVLSVTLCRPPWTYDRIKQVCVFPRETIDEPDGTIEDISSDADVGNAVSDTSTDTHPGLDMSHPDDTDSISPNNSAENAGNAQVGSSHDTGSGCGGGCQSTGESRRGVFIALFALGVLRCFMRRV